MLRQKTQEQIQQYIEYKDIHYKVDPKRKNDFIEESAYITKQSTVMHKCPVCGGHPDIVKNCDLCAGTGSIQDQALHTKAKKREEILPEDNPLWVAITGFMRTPGPKNEARLMNLLRTKIDSLKAVDNK